MKPDHPQRLKNSTIGMFALPGIAFAGIGLPLAVKLPEYYHTELGLNLAMVGIVFIIVKSLNLVADLFIGFYMDKTNSRFGRFKSWMLACLPILCISVSFLFFAQNGVDFIYLAAWLFIVYIGYSIAALSHSGLGAVLSSDYHERNKIFSVWQQFNVIGLIIVLLIPIVGDLFHLSNKQNTINIGIYLVIILIVTISLALLCVKEKELKVSTQDFKLSDMISILKRPNIIRLLLADLWLGLAPGIMASMFFFYFMTIKQLSRPEANICIFLYFIGGFFGAPIWNMMSKKYDKHKTLIVSSLVFACLYIFIALIPKDSFYLTCLVLFLTGMPYAASLLLTRSMMADIGDEIEAETGQDRKATLMSILSATTKLGFALSVFSLTLLSFSGFDSKKIEQTPFATFSLEFLFVGLPFVFLILSAFALRRYDLTPARHLDIINKIKEKA